MTTPAAGHLFDLLSEIDPELAEPALGPLQRLVGGVTDSPNLVVALVGPSGTGKSALFNVLAGADIAEVGALRPTTTDAEVWPIGSRGLVLIDTPPYEVDRDAVCHALDRTDLAIVVVTPDRYADAVVRDLTAQVDRRGVPSLVALNRVPRDPALAASITVDVIASLEGELTMVPEAGRGSIDGSMLRDRVAGLGRSEIVADRDVGAAVFVADQVGSIAQLVEDRDRLIDQAVDAAERSFAEARIDRARLAAAARLSWPIAAKTLLDAVASTTNHAMEGVVDHPALDPRFATVSGAAAANAGPLDAAPLDAWKRSVTSAAVARLQPGRHPLRKRTVERQMWKLAADLAMLPDRRIRAALGDAIAELRMAGNQALTVALREAAEGRIERFIDALGSPSPVSAGDLRQAAEALLVEAGRSVEAARPGGADG
jgi:energy-coupling factor transporter ATP-binding protein EcfA2